MPAYGGAEPDAVRSLYKTATRRYNTFATHGQLSLLSMCFNTLWCGALNHRADGATHFAMLHSDIEPVAWWLDMLMDELIATDADLLSVVVPIKSEQGLTSTAIDSGAGDNFANEFRLTMQEVFRLPETFSAADCGYPDRALLVNSGCWVCRLDRPWVEQVHFTINDRIRKGADGLWRPEVESEDWCFSRQLHRLGCKVLATRKVPVKHLGGKAFVNFQPWGEWGYDHVGRGRLVVNTSGG